MMIARWSIDARFGHKPTVIASMKKWHEEIGSQIGWTADKTRLYTGSLGVPESTVQSEILIADLADLNRAWDKLATIDAHKQWSKDLEPHIVSGSPRWEVFRVIE